MTVVAAILVVAAEWWLIAAPQNLFRINVAALVAALAAWMVLLIWSLVRSRFRTWPLLLTGAIVAAVPAFLYFALRGCSENQACF